MDTLKRFSNKFLYAKRGAHLLKTLFQVVFRTLARPYRIKKFVSAAKYTLLRLEEDEKEYAIPNSLSVQKAFLLRQGLHQLLPQGNRFSYSILIPVYHPKLVYFEMALKSALDQTAPCFEVLVGFDGTQSKEICDLVDQFKQKYPDRLYSHQLDRTKTAGGISNTTNMLAAQAKGHYLLLMDHDDWIRPDLLFRYEQTLYLLQKPEETVLYCDEYKIDEKSHPIPKSGLRKPAQPHFPYLFINIICHCLLIPKQLWDQVEGLRSICDGAQDYDIALRLEAIGAQFYNVPCFLYAWRSHAQSTAKNISQKDYASISGLRALAHYVEKKNLDWEVEAGLLPTTYRACPRLNKVPTIHVVIPFRDQKQLTLTAVKSIQLQEGVKTHITAVNNNSIDPSIVQELEQLNVEVISISEPFNYSRLNNRGVRESIQGGHCELLLLLNNDVELEQGALKEMARWIYQPDIGMVGCRLDYPQGTLQHGGVELNAERSAREMIWEHVEKGTSLEGMRRTQVIRIVDAVTAACCLMRRQLFLDVGGFDEVWYSIAFSDTHLAMKLAARKLWCLYTPYARGIHHESISRELHHIEDYEMSRWLHEKLHQKI